MVYHGRKAISICAGKLTFLFENSVASFFYEMRPFVNFKTPEIEYSCTIPFMSWHIVISWHITAQYVTDMAMSWQHYTVLGASLVMNKMSATISIPTKVIKRCFNHHTGNHTLHYYLPHRKPHPSLYLSHRKPHPSLLPVTQETTPFIITCHIGNHTLPH